MSRAAVIIPTLNEAESIGDVIAELPRGIATDIIIADSGSTDGTQGLARAAGARVLELGVRGYGKACAAGADAALRDCGIIVFMDGDGADRGDLLAQLVTPIEYGIADFVIAVRARALREPGSMSFHQVFAGWLLGLGIGALTGTRYHDMCAYRAIRRSALDALDMREMTYGWNIEMQIKAAQSGLRILEVPMPYRRRAGGTSKVAGSLRGTIRASWRILATFIRVAASRQPMKAVAPASEPTSRCG
jgi:glycosyltransferase involved in cell wall biosynthesis